MKVRDNSNIVLVVDDSPETVELLTDVLDEDGMTVTIALDGATALKVAAQLRPNIVLMDAVMPEMDGFECCRRMKAMSGFDNVPVIFMTGLTEPGDSVRGFDAGGADYVTKPIDIDAMLARINVHLANARHIKSARMALDATEQFLLATNDEGDILWFTPKAYRLLEERFDRRDDQLRLPDPAIVWLRRVLSAQAMGMPLGRDAIFVSAHLDLRMRFVERSERDECLIRLSDTSSIEMPARSFDLTRMDRIAAVGAHFSLSKRETEVLSWIARGKSSRDIAAILALSRRTVDKHLQTIFSKMGVENRTAAAAVILSFS